MIYFFIFFICVFLFFLGQKFKISVLYLISVVSICIFGAIKDYNFGIDTQLYGIPYFERANNYDNFWLYYKDINSDFFYLLLNFIVSRFTDQYYVFCFLLQILSVTPVFFVCYKVRKITPIWIGMGIYLCMFYMLSFNILRQSVALSFSLVTYYYFIKKNYYIAIVFFIFSFLFHPTAVIFLLIPIIFKIQSIRNTTLKRTLIGVLVLFVISSLVFLKQFLGVIILMSDSTQRYAYYLKESQDRVYLSGSLILSLIILLSIFFYAVNSRENTFRYKYHFLIIYVCFFILAFGNYFAPYAERGAYYFGFPLIINLPLLLKSFKDKSLRILLLLITVFCLVMYLKSKFAIGTDYEFYKIERSIKI